MGDDPPHGLGPGDFLEQGGPSYQRKKSTTALGWKLGITLLGGGDGGGNVVGGFGGSRGVRIKE